MPFDGDDSLFRYTSGRWLFNERQKLQERYLKFDVATLIRRIAESVGQKVDNVASFQKLAEGGYNRVFQATMRNGLQVLARLPYPSTTPHRYAVSSEVATINLIRKFGIAGPDILAYSRDRNNDVGSEYIIMHKMSGAPIGDRWYGLSEKQRNKVTFQVVEIEAKLFDMELPAYGSIYRTSDLEQGTAKVDIHCCEPLELCIGPDTSTAWWYQQRARMNFNRGPFRNPLKLLRGVAEKEIKWLETYATPQLPVEKTFREMFDFALSLPATHVETLRKFQRLAPHLIPTNTDLHKPVLLHPDLQPNNIFVDEDFNITGIIDWQGASVLPLFLAARIPEYWQNYQDEDSLLYKVPKLPHNIDSLEDTDREKAYEVFRRRQLHFYYWAFSKRYNPKYWEALNRRTSIMRRKTFSHAKEPWEGNHIPLQADLVHICKYWHVFRELDPGLPEQCPIDFVGEDTAKVLELESNQEGLQDTLINLRAFIGIAEDGWVSYDNYEESVDRATMIKTQTMAACESDDERRMAEIHWPFDDDHDEGITKS